MRTLLVSLAAVAMLSAAESPKIIYSKSFPGSDPAYVAIAIDKQGRGEYKEAPDDDNPLVFNLHPKETEEIFALTEKLGYFSRPLESGLKVAKTGIKTFRYENGPEKKEVQFNYSVEPEAQKLLDWFERISESQRHYINLERAAKFDKLGVNQALLQLHVSYNRGRLVAAEQFLPLLDRIAKNETYMHMARERAATLADLIRNPKPAAGQ
ncbi:MAG TPA: hypothetical protein PLA43_06455 [Bryobacteraceae bacterium]|nr:hypothetical protein [Bryobacteraceae bacterium]HOQ45694.1 hypothetical protein [Bryobacteraceae bacterium]HPQ14438.1 hypothetical protein [Bryobacteraceae bacterium]HPU71580.1 hypothetical protein [Bryobacteraceae bacterium]